MEPGHTAENDIFSRRNYITEIALTNPLNLIILFLWTFASRFYVIFSLCSHEI